VSLVNSLPNEILAMIFEAGHTADSSFISLFEVTISHVIRRWRDVAINTVSLWTHIDVLSTTYEHAMTYLERSKMCSIDIRIGSKERLWHAAPAGVLVDVITAVTCHACRWRSFSFSSDSKVDLQAILRCLANISAPFLTSLSIYYRRSSPHTATVLVGVGRLNQDPCSEILKGGAPLLSEVDLNGVVLFFCWPPLEAVKRLCLDHERGREAGPDPPPSYHQLRAAITASSSLDELSLGLYSLPLVGTPCISDIYTKSHGSVLEY
jgi:hypothetical protein